MDEQVAVPSLRRSPGRRTRRIRLPRRLPFMQRTRKGAL